MMRRSRCVMTAPPSSVSKLPLILPRGTDGDGEVEIDGELKVWHKITLTLDGPYAHEQDNEPNPFTDHRMTVEFKHADGTTYLIPGYFAADGQRCEFIGRFGHQVASPFCSRSRRRMELFEFTSQRARTRHWIATHRPSRSIRLTPSEVPFRVATERQDRS